MTRTSALRAHLLDELEIDAVVQLAELPRRVRDESRRTAQKRLVHVTLTLAISSSDPGSCRLSKQGANGSPSVCAITNRFPNRDLKRPK
jgi:hypothetical protein